MRFAVGSLVVVVGLAACAADDSTAMSTPTTTAPATTAGPAFERTSAAPTTTTTTTPTTIATAPPPAPGDAVVAITEDGRLVALNANNGVELIQLGTVALPSDPEIVGGLGVSQGGGVAYFSEPYEATGRIWSVPVAGGQPTVIGPGAYPAISPDDTTLAFVRPPNTIVVFDVTSGQEMSATTWSPADPDFFDTAGSITRLEWSSDGGAVVFQADYEGSRTFVYRPGEHATLTDATPLADSLVSPTWAGRDLIEGVWMCCYPEYAEPRTLHTHWVDESAEPALVVERAVLAVDWRPLGDRSAEINLGDTGGAAGTITLRNAAGQAAWTTPGRYVGVSV